jgi:hypothetical protein
VQQPDEVDQRVSLDIERHGWHVVLVPPEADSPGWAHSIGLWQRFEHPELLGGAVLELADVGLGASLPVDVGCTLALPWPKMPDMMFPNMLIT